MSDENIGPCLVCDGNNRVRMTSHDEVRCWDCGFGIGEKQERAIRARVLREAAAMLKRDNSDAWGEVSYGVTQAIKTIETAADRAERGEP